MPASVPAELLTVGHGTHAQDDFAALLHEAAVARIVDVRIAPGSRRHPHFGRDALAQWLPAAGIGYRWERRLGGYRKAAPDSPDVALRNTSFRGYAGHMRTDEFRAALAEVLDEGAGTAVMCSESVWWRCHRRLIADAAVMLHDRDVRHVMPDGRLAEHVPTAGLRIAGDVLVYDAAPATPAGASGR